VNDEDRKAMNNLLKIVVLAVLLTATGVAQDQMSGLTWNIGIPTGQMATFNNSASYGGFGFTARKFIEDNTSVGLDLSWNYWSDLTDEIIPLNNGAISGTQIRYYNVFPMFLNAHYYLSDKGDEFKPYFGLNVGTYYILQRLDIGVYTLDNDNWHFGLAPEAGFLFEVSDRTYLAATARYNYAFDSGTTLGGKDDNALAFWGINIGIFWATGWF
jgi:outer membrane protein W